MCAQSCSSSTEQGLSMSSTTSVDEKGSVFAADHKRVENCFNKPTACTVV